MDSFVAEIGGAEAMKEISYKGFYIHAAYGNWIKAALFLSIPAQQGLKERLAYLVKDFEKRYSEEIQHFKQTGNTAVFDLSKIFPEIKDVLDI